MRWLRRKDGQALVEFALVLPVLLLLIVGIAELGLLMNNLVVLRHAGYDLARLASVDTADGDLVDRAGLHAQSVVGSSTPTSTYQTTDALTGETAQVMRFEAASGEWVEFQVSPVQAGRVQGDPVHVQIAWGYQPVFAGWIFSGTTFNLEASGRAEAPLAP